MIKKFDHNEYYDDMLRDYIEKFGHEPKINSTRGVIIDKADELRDAIENNTPLEITPIYNEHRKY